MKIIKGVDDLRSLVGEEIGVSEWFPVSQERINKFADATEDHQWIHIDTEKSKAFSPFKTTIAHGFLTLSLIPHLLEKIWKVEGIKMGVNYGLNKVRFPAPVPVDSKVRVRATLSEIKDVESGVQIMVTATFEREGSDKPVCVAEQLMRLYF